MYEVPIGTSAVVRPGENFTILAIGRMVHEALAAAKTLEGLGVDCEVIDVRSIQPFDSATAFIGRGDHTRCFLFYEAV